MHLLLHRRFLLWCLLRFLFLPLRWLSESSGFSIISVTVIDAVV
jgi:hypothetical protein